MRKDYKNYLSTTANLITGFIPPAANYFLSTYYGRVGIATANTLECDVVRENLKSTFFKGSVVPGALITLSSALRLSTYFYDSNLLAKMTNNEKILIGACATAGLLSAFAIAPAMYFGYLTSVYATGLALTASTAFFEAGLFAAHQINKSRSIPVIDSKEPLFPNPSYR